MCINAAMHAAIYLLACLHVLAVQAECEVLRAEALKWEDDAKTLRRSKDVSTLSLIHVHIQIYNQYSFICNFATITSYVHD